MLAPLLLLLLVYSAIAGSTDVAKLGRLSDPILLIHTLDGSIHALDPYSGRILWRSSSPPLLSSSSSSLDSHTIIPASDGALYSLSLGMTREMLPISPSIVDMVMSTPTRSSQGATLLGDKRDSLLRVHKATGRLIYASKMDICELEYDDPNPEDWLWLSRVDYIVHEIGPMGIPKWNATYARISWLDDKGESVGGSSLFNGMEITGSATGELIVSDSDTGALLWEAFLGAPIAGASGYQDDTMYTLQFTVEQKSSLVFQQLDNQQLYALVPPGTTSTSLTSPDPVPMLPRPSLAPTSVTIVFPDTTSLATLLVVLLLSVVLWRYLKSTKPVMVISMAPQVDGVLKVGKVSIDTGRSLGVGSQGTVVFHGEFDGRTVAVKRLIKQLYEHAATEIALLLESDHHQNVLSYYAKELDGEFIYLALELCDQSVADLIQSPDFTGLSDTGMVSDQAVSIIQGIAMGLEHLHSLNIVHRDLKPTNLLIGLNSTVKIADMGLGKKLDGESYQSVACGSSGWYAPEVLLNSTTGTTEVRMTKAVDIFSLGCVVFYILSGGLHPFGESWERDRNILQSAPQLHLLGSKGVSREVLHFLSWLLSKDAETRPNATELQAHPFFWDDEAKLDFLCHVSDLIESEEAGSHRRMLLERQAESTIGNSWAEHFSHGFHEDLGKYRKYNFQSLRDLLRVIRNKRNHFRDLSLEVQQELGELPSGYLSYFTTRFPNLVMICFLYICAVAPEEGHFTRIYAPLSQSARDHLSLQIISWRPAVPPPGLLSK